jgi:hypothetical protein
MKCIYYKFQVSRYRPSDFGDAGYIQAMRNSELPCSRGGQIRSSLSQWSQEFIVHVLVPGTCECHFRWQKM